MASFVKKKVRGSAIIASWGLGVERPIGQFPMFDRRGCLASADICSSLPGAVTRIRVIGQGNTPVEIIMRDSRD